MLRLKALPLLALFGGEARSGISEGAYYILGSFLNPLSPRPFQAILTNTKLCIMSHSDGLEAGSAAAASCSLLYTWAEALILGNT